MSDVLDDRKAVLSGGFASVSSAGDFDELPNLSKLMCGVPGKASGTWECPPHNLTIWLEGSTAKFALGAGDSEPKCFGTFPGLSSGLLGVEQALVKKTCEWKQPKDSKTPRR
jgi:hypothetical protein